MANAANILPNYSMKENLATLSINPSKYVLNEATGGTGSTDDIFNKTWANNNKYYYYNLDPNLDTSGNKNNKISDVVFKQNLLDVSGTILSNIDDAIENAACGNWNNTNGICNGNDFDGSGTYKNTKRRHYLFCCIICSKKVPWLTRCLR